MDDKPEATENMNQERRTQPHYIDSLTVRRRPNAPEEIAEVYRKLDARRNARNRMMTRITTPIITALIGAAITVSTAEIVSPGISNDLLAGADPTGIIQPSDVDGTAMHNPSEK